MRPTLHHVAIIAEDLDKAAFIYGEVLGLELDNRPDLNFDGLFYMLGDGQQLHLMKLPNPDAKSETPAHGGRYRHFALSVDNLSRITEVLDTHRIAYTVSKSGRIALFFYDFDGNAIEVIQSPKV